MFIGHAPDALGLTERAFQSGWVFGLGIEPSRRHATRSWSIALPPGDFDLAVARLQRAGTEASRTKPLWAGYRSYVVKDPMGQTVELSDPTTKEFALLTKS